MTQLREMLTRLDEAIEHEELAGYGYTKNCRNLRKQRKVLAKAIADLERLERERSHG